MLNKDTRTIIKQLLPINNQMVIENVMSGTDEFQGILYQVDLGKVDDIQEEFGIYDAANFLSALELLETPTVTYQNNVVTATDSDSSLNFITSDVTSLDNVKLDPRIFSTSLSAESDMEFNLSTDIITKVKKASSVFKNFDTLWIVNTPTGTELKLGTQNSFSKSSNTFKVTVAPELTSVKEFELAVPVENVLKIPSTDYKFMVKYNEKQDVHRIVLQNELFTFIMSQKTN